MESFARFVDLAATSAGQIQPAPGVTSFNHCRSLCLNDADCAGFNWMRDGRNASENCLLYNMRIGDTTMMTLMDLYVKETCVNIIITFPPGTRDSALFYR